MAVMPILSGRSLAMSTKSPAWILATIFFGTGDRPGPTVNMAAGSDDDLACSGVPEVLLPSSAVMWLSSSPLGIEPRTAYLYVIIG